MLLRWRCETCGQHLAHKGPGQQALLLKAVAGRAHIDPLLLHGPLQALDEDNVVAAPMPVHADLNPRDSVTGSAIEFSPPPPATYGHSEQQLSMRFNRIDNCWTPIGSWGFCGLES